MLPSEYLEKGWTQCAYAKDCNGKKVKAISKNAVAWCMLGSIQAARHSTGADFNQLIKILIEKISESHNIKGYTTNVSHYNDNPNRTREEVIAIMKQAEQELELNNAA